MDQQQQQQYSREQGEGEPELVHIPRYQGQSGGAVPEGRDGRGPAQETRYGATALGSDVISASGFDANGGGSELKRQKSQENGYDPIWNPDAAAPETAASQKKNATSANVGLQIPANIDGGAVSKSDLPAPTETTSAGNSNSAEGQKEEDVTELGTGTDGSLWQTGGDASGKPQESAASHGTQNSAVSTETHQRIPSPTEVGFGGGYGAPNDVNDLQISGSGLDEAGSEETGTDYDATRAAGGDGYQQPKVGADTYKQEESKPDADHPAVEDREEQQQQQAHKKEGMMARMMEKLPGHLHRHRHNNNKTAIDPAAASDENGSETTDSEQKKQQGAGAFTKLKEKLKPGNDNNNNQSE
ncbi:hypothetical protein CY35_02G037000 [Sphagnum magellanicum]|nr:hypothetical protein CY35_02G037000 [Sphagnum magellanicum]